MNFLCWTLAGSLALERSATTRGYPNFNIASYCHSSQLLRLCRDRHCLVWFPQGHQCNNSFSFLQKLGGFQPRLQWRITNPYMLDARSRLFPPLKSTQQNYLPLIESLWFQERLHTTRRFMFTDHAMTTLKLKAKSKRL
ncbi:hypothetical protein J1N35_017685 [Gossypium stocksii]|uniref:Secreted protein n=1 Tax=Gossypium stocksii TaxID=47602 RepID=A0A9D4A5Y5_9ROSI|nr:hypothetical protein J1N35_017685 [Gossypium stocksii]